MNKLRQLREKFLSMDKKTRKGIIIFFSLFLALFVLDVISKWMCQLFLNVGDQVAIIPNFLYVTLYHNTKIAFSLGIDGVAGRAINIVISIVMSVLIAFYWIKNVKKMNYLEMTTACLLLSGAFGNLIDRAFYWSNITGFDGVIDFVQFYLGGGPAAPNSFVNPFAVFNLADSYLTIGVIMMVVILIIDSVKSSKNDPYNKNPLESETKDEGKEDVNSK